MRLSMNELMKKYGQKPEEQKKGLSKEIQDLVKELSKAKKMLEEVDKKCGDKLTRKKDNKKKN